MKATINDGEPLTGIVSMSVQLDRHSKEDGRVSEFRSAVHMRIERLLSEAEQGSSDAHEALANMDTPATAQLTFTGASNDVCVIDLDDLKITEVISEVDKDDFFEIITGYAGKAKMTDPAANNEFDRQPPIFTDVS